ncbi:MAG: cell division protein FtsH [Blastopirellula sp.]|nr:MAG: cell division protein FtsH [Blastopirellula sp.]
MADQPDRDNKSRDSKEEGGFRPNFNAFFLFALVAVLILALVNSQGTVRTEIAYSEFEKQINNDNVKSVTLLEREAHGLLDKKIVAQEEKGGKLVDKKDDKGSPIMLPREFRVDIDPPSSTTRSDLEKLLSSKNKDDTADNDIIINKEPPSEGLAIFMWILVIMMPLVLFLFIWNSFRRSRDQMMGGGGFLSGFSKSPAKKYDLSDKPTSFSDVAGLDNVKSDLQEIVDFLKSPEKFERLGGQIPKGVLLIGSPGTGKTLLARAIAGEADVPFYSVNGSEFIQMFVGVGASRVRDLFKTAKENSPAIIFIDEIDAVGRQRGAGLGGGHDEREQTLNQILSEMDGFDQGQTVIVVAATNRPDVLDPALLRPGRFDRHITVDRPTLKGRVAIFKVHVKNVLLAEDVSLDRLAAGTVGLTGADIRNLINEAALWATRQDKDAVEMEDFEYARDKILMGAKREDALVDQEKEKTAYHEAGHALLSWLLSGVDRLHKVTVIPRGRALGVTQTLPEEDRLNICESELYHRLAFMLGGRAAEKLVYDELSAGAENDLERATSMARRMVTQWGMSEKLGPVNYKISDEDPFLGREMHEQRQFSEHTMQIIDEEVARILHSAADQAMQVLTDNRDKLETITKALCEHEELSNTEIEALIGPSVQTQNEKKKKEKTASNNGKPQSEANSDSPQTSTDSEEA